MIVQDDEAGTKGAIPVFDGARAHWLPAGPDGYVMVADSSQHGGVRWIAASSGGASASTNQGSFLISGGGVAWVSGFVFNVSAATYSIIGTVFNSLETAVTLAAADGSHNRYDLIVVDNTGKASAITGTAATTPIIPSADPATQLALATIYVPTSSTSSPNITSILLYDEDTGPSAEWTATASVATFVVSSTTNPYSGSTDIQGTAVAAATYVQLATSTPIDPTASTQLVFHIRSKGAWLKKSLSIGWYSTGVLQGQAVALLDGAFGFSSTVTTAYQQIVIPIGLFALAAGSSVNQLRMTVLGTGATIGMYLDLVQLQTNSNALPSGYPATIGALTLLGNPTSVSAAPEAITLGAGFTVTGTTVAATGAGGSVVSASVVSANGFAGSVATPTTTPAITISTSVTGILKGNGTAVSAATAGTDYLTGNQAITLSSDATGSGTTSIAVTLATVNTDTSAVGSSTSIPTITANAKGLVTAVAGNVVIAPAGTLSGTTLNSTVVTSSLTTVGVIGAGTWQGTVVTPTYGGTGLATLTAHAVVIGEGTSNVAFATIGVAGRLLTDQGASADPAFASTVLKIDSHFGAITADTDGSTITFNLSTSDWHSVTLGGNRTLALSNATIGQQFSVILTQDGSGSRTVTWFATIKWPAGTAPTLSTAAGAIDVFTFKCYGSGTYYGFTPGQAMA